MIKKALIYTEQNHMTFIDPFNNVDTIAGQGTLAKKFWINQVMIQLRSIIYLLLWWWRFDFRN